MPKYDLNTILFKSGDLFLPKSVRNILEYYYIGADRSAFYVTNWTIIHFLSGIATAYLLFSKFTIQQIYVISILVHTIWELWQIFGENTPISTLRGQIDVLVDTVAYMLGVWIYITRKQKL
jgi:hypothetical protein